MKECRKRMHQYDPGAYRQCPECAAIAKEAYKQRKKAYKKEYYNKNKDKERKNKRERYANDRQKVLQTNRQWQDRNKEWVRQYNRIYRKQKDATDPIHKLKHKIRSLIYSATVRGGFSKQSRTQLILGCSYQELYDHLESTAIRNYGCFFFDLGVYHIDHIVPLSTASSEEEIIALNHYKNLQLLYPKDNLIKSDTFNFLS